MRKDLIEAFRQEYLDTLPPDSLVRGESYEAESFGDSPQMADELGALIVDGTKTATCSALWEDEDEGKSLPETGAKRVMLDGSGEPLCIIETVEVEVRPYNEVNARLAHEEGEEDRSLEHWRDAHWRFLTRSLAETGREPTPQMPLVCERLQVAYRPPETEIIQTS